jgi:hypothetical protein
MCSFESSLERFIFRLTSECKKKKKVSKQSKVEAMFRLLFVLLFPFSAFFYFFFIHKHFTVKYFCFKWRTLTKHRRQAFCTFDFDFCFQTTPAKIINFFLLPKRMEISFTHHHHGDLNFLALFKLLFLKFMSRMLSNKFPI